MHRAQCLSKLFCRVAMLVAMLGLPLAAFADERKIEDCVIEPNEVAEVSSSVDGVVDQVKITRGDLIKRGQVIATLNSKVEKATVELARVRAERDQAIKARTARLEFTQRRLERNRELFEQKLISEQVVDEAETDVLLAELELGEFLEERRIAEIELQRAQEALAIRTVRSPFSGVVVDVLVAPGESIENRPLVRIASIDPLNVEVIAPVELFGQITTGMQAKVIPEQPIGGEHNAKVVLVDRVLDAASGTFGIRLQLRNRGYKLPAGLRCNVIFEPAPQSGLENAPSGTLGDAVGQLQQTGEPVLAAISGTAANIADGAGSEYVYTVYLFSTRSADIAGEVSEKFRKLGYDTEVLQTRAESVTRYRVAVTGFSDLDAARDYSESVTGTLGVNKTWIGKNPLSD